MTLPPGAFVHEKLVCGVSLDEEGISGNKITSASLALLSQNDLWKAWSGLVLERIECGGKVVYNRLGHFHMAYGTRDLWTRQALRVKFFGHVKKRIMLV